MGQRNILCTNQMMNIDMDQQGQGYHYPGPHIHIGGHPPNFQQPNIRTMVAASGSGANYDGQYLPERHDSSLIYGMAQYNGVHHHHHHHHHHNLDLGVATPGHFYYSFMPPSSSTRVIPVPSNHSDQLSSSSGGYGVVGSSTDEFGRGNHFIDGARGLCKRKVPESFQGNHNPFNASAMPSSSAPPEGSSSSNPASFALPRYPGNGNPPAIVDVGHQSAARSRLAAGPLDSSVMHDHHNHLAQGSFVGQHFQPSGGVWLEPHLAGGSGDGGALSWNQPPGIPFMHASVETPNMVVPRHHEPNGRSSQGQRHPPSVNHRNQTHHSSQPMQRARGNGSLTAASHRSSSNSSRNAANLPHNALEIIHRHAGNAPPTGIRIYRPHRGAFSDTATRQHQLAQLRYLHADEVAILEIPDLYEVGEFADHHSDMRLDIEDMSYEELLALGERIGSVNTGLSEETIAGQLKTVSYLSPGINMNVEQPECSDKEAADSCIICQDNYKIFERIGVLDCGHDYHAECLKKWLVIKNVCPICKSEALTTSMDL